MAVITPINTSLTALDESLAELAAKGQCVLTIHVDLVDRAGESHSLIWKRNGKRDPSLIARLRPEARAFFQA